MKRVAVLLTVALLILGTACGRAILSASATGREERSFPLDPGGAVSLENVNGDVTVRESATQSVRLVAEKKARAFDDTKAREALAKLQIAVESSPKEISIETVYPSSKGFHLPSATTWLSVDYTLDVPKGTRIKLSTVNGTVDVEVQGSEVSCDVTNGSVRVERAGLLSATTVNGRIVFSADSVDEVSSTNGHVEGRILGLKPGAGHVETVNGSVTLALSESATLHLDAENVNGSIRNALSGLAAEKHSLSGDLNGGGSTLSVETVNGSIEINPLK